MAHYYACKFGLNRLRIDGDIRQKPLYIMGQGFLILATPTIEIFQFLDVEHSN